MQTRPARTKVLQRGYLGLESEIPRIDKQKPRARLSAARQSRQLTHVEAEVVSIDGEKSRSVFQGAEGE